MPPSTGAVVAAALELFRARGFDHTSVEQIAKAAGVSRSTFFRQFGRKEDVVFADHELLLTRLQDFLAQPHEDPWLAACEGAFVVFRHFAANLELARARYELVRDVPALREREILTVYRYERLFDEYLRQALPDIDPADAVGYAAIVAATHNHMLRQLLRGERITEADLRKELEKVMRRFGVLPGEDPAANDDLVVAVFPRSMPTAEIARRIQSRLPG